MRARTVVVAVVLLASLGAAPASAHHYPPPDDAQRFVADAPLPCSVACPYWTDLSWNGEEACRTTPLVPAQSFDDIRIVVPEGAAVLFAGIYPRMERYSVLCRVLDPGTPGERYVFERYASNWLVEPCAMRITGCPWTVVTYVGPGEVYVLRVFNDADLLPADGRYWFTAS